MTVVINDYLSVQKNQCCFRLIKLFSGNVLYVESKSCWHVQPIDFEYSSYNYRLEHSIDIYCIDI